MRLRDTERKEREKATMETLSLQERVAKENSRVRALEKTIDAMKAEMGSRSDAYTAALSSLQTHETTALARVRELEQQVHIYLLFSKL